MIFQEQTRDSSGSAFLRASADEKLKACLFTLFLETRNKLHEKTTAFEQKIEGL